MAVKFPIRIPDSWKLTITQPFRSTELAEWYKAKGINMPEHNGVDVACGDGPQTYGTACVWPFPFPGVVYDAAVDAPVGAKLHARSQIDGTDPATGISYSVLYLHLSAVTPSKTFKQGEIIGYIGNNGAVFPEPTPAAPFSGSHLHLGLGIKKPGELNYTLTDPLLTFDANDPYRGPDDPSRDKPVFEWAQGSKTPVAPPTPPEAPKPLPAPDLTASDRLALVAASLMAQGNTAQARIVFAVAGVVKAFGW